VVLKLWSATQRRVVYELWPGGLQLILVGAKNKLVNNAEISVTGFKVGFFEPSNQFASFCWQTVSFDTLTFELCVWHYPELCFFPGCNWQEAQLWLTCCPNCTNVFTRGCQTARTTQPNIWRLQQGDRIKLLDSLAWEKENGWASISCRLHDDWLNTSTWHTTMSPQQ